jgi:glutathione S-transferase
LYLLETYDSPNHLISFASSSPQDRAHLLQYHFFQGPNLSAALYFTRAKPNPEARQRYVDESIRVLDVLEKALQTNGTDEVKKEWLVGGNCTAADLVFVPYMWSMEVCCEPRYWNLKIYTTANPRVLEKLILGDENPNLAKGFPNVEAWMQRMSGRATIKKVKIDRDAALAALAASIATSGQGQQK